MVSEGATPRDRASRRFRARSQGMTITAIPSSTSAMPASRSAPNCSPKTSEDEQAPTNGTSKANGATVAAAYWRRSRPQIA